MKKIVQFIFLFSLSMFFLFSDEIDLHKYQQDFVIKTRQIKIPEYPNAFNPSIIAWGKHYLLSFRVIPDRKSSFDSWIGLVFLSQDFEPISKPQKLHLTDPLSPIPPRAEDARLVRIGNYVYIVYSNNPDQKISRVGFRVYFAQLTYDMEGFEIENPQHLVHFEGETPNLREKNWVPFEHHSTLFFSYSLSPHTVLCPFFDTGTCQTFAESDVQHSWQWGILRGGTPGLLIGQDYLAFFHSSKKMKTVHSDGEEVLHYFMGAYLFSSDYPFELKKISPFPIIGKDFYSPPYHKPYWHPVRVIFPGGFIFNEKHIWIVYGRQDHEMWVVQLLKKPLLESLISIE